MKACAHCSATLEKAMRCGQCKSAWYCTRDCQKQHWSIHKSQCKALALTLLASATAAEPFAEVATVQTRGAAGWEHFAIDGKHYLVVANFFTSGPGRQPSMETDSTVFVVDGADGRSLRLAEVQGFRTVGAHGVTHCERDGQHYL